MSIRDRIVLTGSVGAGLCFLFFLLESPRHYPAPTGQVSSISDSSAQNNQQRIQEFEDRNRRLIEERLVRARRFQEAIRPPESQMAFVRAVTAGQEAFAAAGRDEFLQGASRPARRQALCSLGVDRQPIQAWTGQVSTRTTNGDGKGVLGITLAGGAVLTTWNNYLSDTFDRTLIEPGSPVFLAMGEIHNGQYVRFSGRFFRSDVDCVREGSMTIRGSMNSPSFIFRFDTLEAIPE